MKNSKKNNNLLINISKKLRLETLNMIEKKGNGHIGGTFSCIDILVSLYYGDILKINKNNFTDNNRNRFILSKGHACLALYKILLDLKIINKKTYESYGENGGLGGQLDMNVPGVDWVTGSLGHAIGVSNGFALASKIDKLNFKSYVLLGDAECDEGSIWESIMFAGSHKLNNLIVLVDRNRLSVTDTIDENSYFNKFDVLLKSLGWNYYEINGHSIYQIVNSLKKANTSKKPVMILCNTIKGKGVSFMENNIKWHHSLPSVSEFEKARKELG